MKSFKNKAAKIIIEKKSNFQLIKKILCCSLFYYILKINVLYEKIKMY